MLHFIGGEIIPRRVLCPWRAHLLASTLPAVARATAACSMRCAWMVGCGLWSPEGYRRAEPLLYLEGFTSQGVRWVNRENVEASQPAPLGLDHASRAPRRRSPQSPPVPVPASGLVPRLSGSEAGRTRDLPKGNPTPPPLTSRRARSRRRSGRRRARFERPRRTQRPIPLLGCTGTRAGW